MTIHQINDLIQEIDSLKTIAAIYSEIAAVKLERIRSGIERNRDFFEEISQVFYQVKATAKEKQLSSPQNKTGTVSILLTSNYHFAGVAEGALTHDFIIQTAKQKTDRIVIGKAGDKFLTGINYLQTYHKISFKTDIPDASEIRQLYAMISKYQQVIVYHCRFASVLMQKPMAVDITESEARHTNFIPGSPQFDYIFEPELIDMLNFFESQITILLLEQTFLEAELSRTASRLTSMDEAETNANNMIKDERKKLFAVKRSIDHNQMLETIAGLMRYNRKNAQ